MEMVDSSLSLADALTAGGKVFPMLIDTLPQDEDTATVAIIKPERNQALRSLQALGWHLETEQVCTIKTSIDSL